MERQVALNEDIIRFMTVRIDALPTEPSAMMKRGDRERERSAEGAPRGDRPDRGDRGDRAPRGDRPDRAPRAY
jgi:small subunit ribosomal protein S6